MYFNKKIFSLLLILVLLTFIASCAPIESTTTSSVPSSVSHTVSNPEVNSELLDDILNYGNSPDLSKITMTTEFPEYSRKDKEITVIITNNNENDLFSYDPDVFYLERFENETWKEVTIKNSSSLLMAVYVLPGQTTSDKKELSPRYKVPLKKGKYRIIIAELSAEFTIK